MQISPEVKYMSPQTERADRVPNPYKKIKLTSAQDISL